MSVHLVIPGRPRPGERAGTDPDGHRYSQPNTRAVQAAVAEAWTARPEPWRSPTLRGPVAVWVVAFYARPKRGHYLQDGGLTARGLRTPFPTSTKADLDNLSKPLLDGLTGLAWVDDHQVCELHVLKRWCGPEGERTEVRISPMQAPTADGLEAEAAA
ncbi:MAG: RusA family crossover junction endodeoxyribonuclease [Thermoleophilia bacterium]